MIATDRFVFLHLHKCGGTFVTQWLLEYFHGATRIGYHLPRSKIPPEFRRLPVLGTVRNPWSYYVSWYSFQSGMQQPNALFRLVSDDGRLGFNGTIRNMLELGRDDGLLDRLLARLPADYTNRGLNRPARNAAGIRGTGLGFYSFLHGYMYDGEPAAKVVRLEEMRTAFPDQVEGVGGTVTAAAREAMANRPVARGSNHREYAEYYDASLRDLVGERDQSVIGPYSYCFG